MLTTTIKRLSICTAVITAGYLLFSEPSFEHQRKSRVRETQPLRAEASLSNRRLQGAVHEYSDLKPTNAPTFEFEKLEILGTPATESSHARIAVTLIDLVPTDASSTLALRPRAIRSDNRLYPLLPDYSFIFLEDGQSAQARAYTWTINHPKLPTLDEWRILQLFSVSTFYYSLMKRDDRNFLEGSNNLNYSLPECEWGAAGLPVNTHFVCDDTAGRVQRIALWPGSTSAPMATHDFIPPELSLLASLEAMDVAMVGINVSLRELLPTSLSELSNLTFFSFPFNEIQGTIPEDVNVTLHGLTKLNMKGNLITGKIPTTIGLLSELTSLSFGENNLVGMLPSELGLLQKLTSLELFNNSLSGKIPTELSNLQNLMILKLTGNNFTGSPAVGICDLIPASLGCQASLPLSPDSTTQPTVRLTVPPLPRPSSAPTHSATLLPSSAPTVISFTNTDRWVGY